MLRLTTFYNDFKGATVCCDAWPKVSMYCIDVATGTGMLTDLPGPIFVWNVKKCPKRLAVSHPPTLCTKLAVVAAAQSNDNQSRSSQAPQLANYVTAYDSAMLNFWQMVS